MMEIVSTTVCVCVCVCMCVCKLVELAKEYMFDDVSALFIHAHVCS